MEILKGSPDVGDVHVPGVGRATKKKKRKRKKLLAVIRKHNGPGPHPSGSPQSVHGLRGGGAGEYEKNRVVGDKSIDSKVGHYSTTVDTRGVFVSPGSLRNTPPGKWKIERSDGVMSWDGTGGEEAMLAQLAELDLDYAPEVKTKEQERMEWIEQRWLEDADDHGFDDSDFDDWLRDNFNDEWRLLQKADDSDPEQADIDEDNLYDLDGISHRTGGRWLHDTPVQKHGGPGPHKNGSPQSVHGRSRDVREPVVTFNSPDIVNRAVDGWFELNPELTQFEDVDWSSYRQDHDFQMKVAAHYDSLPMYDPAAKPAFEAFSAEIEDQFKYLTEVVGIKFEAVDYDPYRNLPELAADLVENGRVKVMATAVTGGHPMISDEVNDKFRFVHDIFGHVATGRNFDRHGEEAAFLHHASMFTDAARPAMASETRGQNASLIANREFGPQRAALMEPWAYELRIKKIGRDLASASMKRREYWMDSMSKIYSGDGPSTSHIVKWDDGWQTTYTTDASDLTPISDLYALKQIKKQSQVGRFSADIEIAKADEHKNLVFGWASVAFSKDGSQIVDRQGHMIDVEDLEDAAYDFVVKSYGTGDMHRSEPFGELVESMVFTKEKAEALGLPPSSLPQGWWVGFRVPPEHHEQVRNGKRSMFSIEGTAKLVPLED